MILDTSAVVAVMMKEPGWEVLFEKLSAGGTIGIGTPTLAETGIVLTSRIGPAARGLLSRFLAEFGVSTIPFGDSHWRETVEAYDRFGKGRHPASLNFGDCMSYATAKLAQRPLLYVGGDFPKTDLAVA